jgi:hypothetical protein
MTHPLPSSIPRSSSSSFLSIGRHGDAARAGVRATQLNKQREIDEQHTVYDIYDAVIIIIDDG